MEKLDQVSSIFWLILGLAVVYSSYQLGLGSLTHLGPGFFPFLSGVILCGLSTFIFFKGRLIQKGRSGVTTSQLWAGTDWANPIYVTVGLLVYAMIFIQLGYLLATTILLIYFFKFIGRGTWLRSTVGAVLTTVISYVLFGVWLQVQLPKGFLEELLF